MRAVLCAFITVNLFTAATLQAQSIPADEHETLLQGLHSLQAKLANLPESRKTRSFIADAHVCAKAVEWILRHEEFYEPNYVDLSRKVLALGESRAEQLHDESPAWATKPGRYALGYRSRVDDSWQPYAISLPHGYNPGEGKRWPLHLVLHGRNGRLNEVSFIAQHEGKEVPAEQSWIQLDVFGRVNNAYRWAGETDVFEALEQTIKRFKVDERRITLWGFSMGGAGAWHLGLHHPSRWASVGAGAGFVDFYKYQKQTEPLPEYQHRTLRIYDAVDYVGNLANVPLITYGGENDPQLAASLTMQERARPRDLPLQVLIGPEMGHKFDPQSFEQFMAFHAEHSRKGRPAFPGRREIDFETYTLKYNRCDWLTIQEQQQVYERSHVASQLDAQGMLDITTENVAALSIARGVADRVRLDGEAEFDLNAAADGLLPDVYFVLDGDEWDLLDYDQSLAFLDNPDHRKRHNLQGPIDDAFMEPFLCVRGTGDAWSHRLSDYGEWTFARFQREFDKWMRANAQVVNDTQLTAEQIAGRHLILFGDPGSNSVIAQVVADLPIEWTPDLIRVAGQTFDTSNHAVLLVYPNPLNPAKYVVINSGMTMHTKDFKASNSWLFPKLGDVAVIRFEADRHGGFVEETVWANIFDTSWELPPSARP